LSRVAECYTTAYPNAGLPDGFGYHQKPEEMAEQLEEFFKNSYVNMIGGCCGTTPDHIAAIAKMAAKYPPRKPIPKVTNMRLSGILPVTITAETNFLNIGERCNVAGSSVFKNLVMKGNYEKALSVCLAQVEGGAQVLDLNFDEGLLDSEYAMRKFVNLIIADPNISILPLMMDSSKFHVIEAGLKCAQGKCIVNSISLKEGEETFIKQAKIIRKHGAAVVVMAVSENVFLTKSLMNKDKLQKQKEKLKFVQDLIKSSRKQLDFHLKTSFLIQIF
jgi:5-methyltetrahydrofolate--homocysteine methyltransferase